MRGDPHGCASGEAASQSADASSVGASLVGMFEMELGVQLRVPDDRGLLNEARRRTRTAAGQFRRPVETHYVKSSGMMFGVVPLTDKEQSEAESSVARSLDRIVRLRHRETPRH